MLDIHSINGFYLRQKSTLLNNEKDYRLSTKTISVLHLKADSINIRSYRTLCRKRLSASNKEKENQNSNPIFFSEKFKMKLSAKF